MIPNTINDMHDGLVPASTRTGDAWAKKNLANYFAWAKTKNSLLILTTDESDSDKNNHVLTVIAGDPRIVQAGVSDWYFTHLDLHRLMQAMLPDPEFRQFLAFDPDLPQRTTAGVDPRAGTSDDHASCERKLRRSALPVHCSAALE